MIPLEPKFYFIDNYIFGGRKRRRRGPKEELIDVNNISTGRIKKSWSRVIESFLDLRAEAK